MTKKAEVLRGKWGKHRVRGSLLHGLSEVNERYGMDKDDGG